MHLRTSHALILSAGVTLGIGLLAFDLNAQQTPPQSPSDQTTPPTSPEAVPPATPPVPEPTAPAEPSTGDDSTSSAQPNASDDFDQDAGDDAAYDPQDPNSPRGPRGPRGPRPSGPGRGPGGDNSAGGAGGAGGAGWNANAPSGPDTLDAADYAPFADMTKGLDKVVSTVDASGSMYTLYQSKKDGRLLAELPREYPGQLFIIAPTVAGGNEEAGVMGGTTYAYWKRIDKNLVLIEPNFLVRSSGDAESKRSIKGLYTDRVILDVPIVSVGPGGGPVIDLKSMLVGQYGKFFGGYGLGSYFGGADTRLSVLERAKAFPENLEITYQMPGPGGRLMDLHYSIRSLPEDPTFKPRLADSRVGYFNEYYTELGKPGDDEKTVRYINRWNLEKADPSLKRSPPKQPIVWYIESTTPIRYRQFVREGILSWNKAFEECGIVNAMECYQQDAQSGAHMEKDPEDARYNFFRWNTSSQAYAIGPSRGDPRTGRLIDADVVWHAGLTEAIMGMLKNLSGEIATINFTPETMVWLDQHPQWDPRVRLAPAAERGMMLGKRGQNGAEKTPAPKLDDPQSIEPPVATRRGVVDTRSGSQCKIGEYMSMNIALFACAFDAGMLQASDNDTQLDGLPEEFLGAMIRYVSAHEVGHCLGLQHNFSASTIRSLQQINADDYTGGPIVGSVMEYAGVNIRADDKDGSKQGPFATPTLGPYDIWAIQFGYGPDADRAKVLARVNEADLIFHNDMSMGSPDPRVMTWDMGSDSLAFCDSRMRIVQELRGKIVSDLVKDGQPWRKARDRYNAMLNNHVQAIAIASRWIGSSYINRNYKGDPDGKPFIENVPADKQRAALQFVIANSFNDGAFGLTPDLIEHLGVQYFPDMPGAMAIDGDPSFELHDLVAGVQAAAMTMVMNPTTLRRLYDNEYRTNDDPKPITLAEVLATLTAAAWSELDGNVSGNYTAVKPMVSSFRRNLQREHVERLIDLMMIGDAANPAVRTISTLSSQTLRDVNAKIKKTVDSSSGKLDPYTLAHLNDTQTRIQMALDAQYVITR